MAAADTPPDPGALEAYEYLLPETAIAQVPVEPRDDARLLVALDPSGPPADRRVRDLADLLEPGDVVVVNETRVVPARLVLQKPSGGSVEVLLLEPHSSDGEWQALVRPSRRIPEGTVLRHGGRAVLTAGGRVSDDDSGDGRRLVTVLDPGLVAEFGRVALPPYIRTPLAEDERYQTVYSRRAGSVAAPTAGLHFTTELLERCRRNGVVVATVDLAVGLDTFRPMSSERLDDHRMHSEWYSVPPETWRLCKEGRRVVAVGTTTVRALEAAAGSGALSGRTDLFIRPGARFRVVDVLMTNFHLPRSTLLVMLAAFCGPHWRRLYEHALAGGYRFLSFGDAMLVGRWPPDHLIESV